MMRSLWTLDNPLIERRIEVDCVYMHTGLGLVALSFLPQQRMSHIVKQNFPKAKHLYITILPELLLANTCF